LSPLRDGKVEAPDSRFFLPSFPSRRGPQLRTPPSRHGAGSVPFSFLSLSTPHPPPGERGLAFLFEGGRPGPSFLPLSLARVLVLTILTPFPLPSWTEHRIRTVRGSPV